MLYVLPSSESGCDRTYFLFLDNKIRIIRIIRIIRLLRTLQYVASHINAVNNLKQLNTKRNNIVR